MLNFYPIVLHQEEIKKTQKIPPKEKHEKISS